MISIFIVYEKLQRSKWCNRRLITHGIPLAVSGPDGRIPPALGTNQIAGFIECRPLTHWEKKIIRTLSKPQVCAVFRTRVIWHNVPYKFIPREARLINQAGRRSDRNESRANSSEKKRCPSSCLATVQTQFVWRQRKGRLLGSNRLLDRLASEAICSCYGTGRKRPGLVTIK